MTRPDKSTWFVALGAVLVLAPVAIGLCFFFLRVSLRWVFDQSIIFGLCSLLAWPGLEKLAGWDRRPFTDVPFEAPPWEFMVLGATAAVGMLLMGAGLAGALVVIPVLVPLKVLSSWVLGDHASLAKATLSLPIVYLAASVGFAAIYVALIAKSFGNLSRAGSEFHQAGPGKPWPSPIEPLYFSLCTMIGVGAGWEPTGTCRWVAVFQAAAAKLLEVLIVVIGLALLLQRTVHR